MERTYEHGIVVQMQCLHRNLILTLPWYPVRVHHTSASLAVECIHITEF